jgi:DNA-binding response OmpR family regulator
MAKILVVDDEPQVRDMVAFKLAARGHQVVRASDGEQAMALAAAEHPDLIVLDVVMPRLNGFEVLGRLKADAHLHRIPVIIVSARGGEHDVRTGRRRSAVDYVVKPFSLKDLAARVERVLEGCPVEEPAAT